MSRPVPQHLVDGDGLLEETPGLVRATLLELDTSQFVQRRRPSPPIPQLLVDGDGLLEEAAGLGGRSNTAGSGYHPDHILSSTPEFGWHPDHILSDRGALGSAPDRVMRHRLAAGSTRIAPCATPGGRPVAESTL